MLARLSGRWHQVLSAVALASANGLQCSLSRSEVRFRALSARECAAYWDSGEPRDKAGAYAIQGRGAVFVEASARQLLGRHGTAAVRDRATAGWRGVAPVRAVVTQPTSVAIEPAIRSASRQGRRAADDLGAGCGGESCRGRRDCWRRRARSGARVAVLPENFSFMGLRRCGQARDRRARRRRSGAALSVAAGARARTVDRRRHHTDGAASPAGASPPPAWCTTMTGAAWRATTRFICSTSIFPARARATASRPTSLPARAPVLVPTPAGLLGLSVCYDMRFPELYRQLSRGRRAVVQHALGLYRADRPRALGDAAARHGRSRT